MKNILLFSGITGVIVYNCMKARKILISRYNYAFNFAREFQPSIALKIRIVKYHIVATVTYCILIITTMILTKCVFKSYLSEQNIMVIMDSVDFIGLCFFLIIYRPRKFPQYYNVFYDDLNENNSLPSFNIFEVRLPAVTNEYEKIYGKLNKKDEKDVKSNYEIPVLLINPTFNEEADDKDIIEKVSIGMRIKI